MVKKYIWLAIVVVLGILAIALFLSYGNSFRAEAKGTQWGPITWGTCESNGPQCGTDNGTQSGSATCVSGGDKNECSLGTWVPTTYKCDVDANIHGTNYDVSAFYNKPTGDDHHCHRIVWDSLGTSGQNSFKTMHHDDYDYSSPNHGNWTSAYNTHIVQNPDATTDVAGHFENPDVKSDFKQSCNTGVTQYDSCDAEGTCPTECGYQGGTVSDGKGGKKECQATNACEKDEKHVDVVGSCDGSVLVTVHGGDTRRTWRVEGVEAWIDYNEVHEFKATTLDVVIEWKHKDHWDLADESYVTRTKAEDCETPAPQTSSTGGGGGTTEAKAPVCPNGNTVNVAANIHVIRNGKDATVNFFITEGNSANIYWRVVGSSEWQNAVSDVKPNGDNYVSYTIHDLDPLLGYDFGIQQKIGCGGGLITAVVVDGPEENTFRVNYYTW